MCYPGRGEIYESVIRNRVAKALDEKETEFAKKYRFASDEVVLEYVKACASELKHTPWPREIIGGRYLAIRFGTWKNVLRSAELPNPKTPDISENFAIVREETENQKILYRRRKAEKKERRRQKTLAKENGNYTFG